MKGIKLEAPYEIGMVDMNVPQPKRGEALIKVKCAGICGSDIGAFRGKNQLVSYPRIIGHEIAGEVISTPEESVFIKNGDKVIVDPYLYCGTCYPCGIGRTNCCENLKVLGVHVDGGMAEYFSHPIDRMIKVPQDMEWKYIPMAEPLTIALHAVHRTKLKAGEHIAIIGAGAIGLLIAMVAMDYGAIPIILDIVEERLLLAKSLGIKHVINTKTESSEKKVWEYTSGRNAEVVVEASGANESILLSLKIVSHAGRIALTGWPSKATLFPTDVITRKEIDVRGSRTSAGEFQEAIDMIYQKRIAVDKLLTKVISMEEVPEVVRMIDKHPGDYLKVNVMCD